MVLKVLLIKSHFTKRLPFSWLFSKNDKLQARKPVWFIYKYNMEEKEQFVPSWAHCKCLNPVGPEFQPKQPLKIKNLLRLSNDPSFNPVRPWSLRFFVRGGGADTTLIFIQSQKQPILHLIF